MSTTQTHFGGNLAGGVHKSIGGSYETFRAQLDTDMVTLTALDASPDDATVDLVEADIVNLYLGITTCDFNVVADTTIITTMDKYRKMARQAEAYFASILPGP